MTSRPRPRAGLGEPPLPSYPRPARSARRLALLTSLLALACTAPPPPSADPGEAAEPPLPLQSASEGAPVPAPAPAAAPAPADAADGEIVVLARVSASGPIGHGTCNQCSHEIQVLEALAGDLGPSPLWVHFEVCGGAAYEPGPGDTAPCSLEIGAEYRLRLRRGASTSFGDAPMILAARPR